MQEIETKYALVYRKLRDKLSEGRFPVGSRLPTEEQMSDEFDVSRITIRRALEQLVNEGYVNRRQGSGYSVIALSPPQQNCLSSFTDMVFRSGATPTSRLLSIKEIGPRDKRTAGLPADLVDQGKLLQVRRLRCIDDRPVMLVSTWLSKAAIGDATAGDFPETGTAQSIIRILQGKFGLTWDAACEEISPMLADAEASKLLGLDEGTPILKQACIAFGKNGRTVFYEDLLRAGTIVFESFALHRQAPEGLVKRH